jgi:hypothetical protein
MLLLLFDCMDFKCNVMLLDCYKLHDALNSSSISIRTHLLLYMHVHFCLLIR